MAQLKGVKYQVIEENYALYCGDSCEIVPGIPDNSIGFSIFSPPFAQLYVYSDSPKDLGNCSSYEDFFVHFSFLVKELERVMIPGRICCVHCMDIPTQKSKEGYIGFRDFPGDIIRCFEVNGFINHSPRITIWKNPLVAATRTHALGLAHKQIVKDSSMCSVGPPDYILVFRKKGDNPKPIAHPEGLQDYAGSKPMPSGLDRYIGWSDPKTNKRAQWIWQQYASPVWMDIRQGKVLPFKRAKEADDEKHLCPLQREVVERCLVLWSAPDDVVLTPFLGVGTEIYEAVRLGRKGIGIELKHAYFRQAKRNLASLKNKQKAATAGFEV